MKTLYISGIRGNTIGANTYIYYDEQTLTGAVIDPGVGSEKVMRVIEAKNIDVKHILLTHGHFDHIAAVPDIKRKYNADVCALKEENVVLSNPGFNASNLIGNPTKIIADRFLNDGEEINVGNGVLKVIHTPGHTIGGACYYAEKSKIVFSGDTLFFESIGRTDFHTGNPYSIVSSIKQKLFSLPEDVKVLCGHGEHTTIGHEKKHNPHIN